MSDIEITKNEYNTICDTYGCSNTGSMIVGRPGENQGFKTIMCEDCLQNIINAAPLEMILNRPELAEVEEEDNTPITLSPIAKGLEEVGKALEGEEVSLHDLKFNSLKELAALKGITVPFGTSKEQLIELIEGK